MRWSAQFAEPLVLNDGTRLATLKQAGEHLIAEYGAVTHNASLGEAMTLLMAAAKSGGAERVGAAREQLALFLRSQRAIGPAAVDIHERMREAIRRAGHAASPARKAVRAKR